MWQGTDSNTNLGYWVELGAAYGNPQGAKRYWYWADNRPGGGYHEHDQVGQPLSLNTTYSLEVVFSSGSTWDVLGPFPFATSTGSPPHGSALEAGTEITSNGPRSVGHISSLEYFDTSFGIHDGWSGAKIFNTSGGPATASWVGSGHKEVKWSTSC
jgi:hypothetical protein